ncbi:HEAT repeat domain-containing protein [Treponema pedis]|nr:HEAT repeat domain-containing protein [Treponema pedis]QOW59999.1 HEAT repeat domain-containing protein [Treponema pedis]QSI05339.1 HEAT repeat domain-containing protein [Treponema pedis]
MRRKSLFFVLMILLLSSVFTFAEENSDSENSDSMMTVEEAYLNSMEGVILREMISSEGRDSKLVALQVIEEAVEGGKMSPELQKALDSLATVGLTTLVRENGRIANNYPDVRMRACRLLGKVKNEQAKDTLMKVMYTDNEPAVIMEAVKSLGELGFNNNDEVVEMVNFINRKFDIVNPTSSLALEVLNTYEKLAPSVKNKQGMIDNIMRIANNYNYITPVRNKAVEVLRSIIANGNSSKK